MLKTVSVALLLVIIPVTIYSQGVRMGLNFNPQTSWMKSDVESVKSDGATLGFSFGLQSDFFFAERYSLSSGLYINNTGGKLLYSDTIAFTTNTSTDSLFPETQIKYKLQYIEIPLSFRMESNQIGYFVYYAQFGITNQFRIGASADIESINPLLSTSMGGVGCKDEVSFYNLGYNIGAGFNYYFSKNTALTVGLIYNNGFIDATSNEGKAVSDNVSVRSVALKIGVLF